MTQPNSQRHLISSTLPNRRGLLALVPGVVLVLVGITAIMAPVVSGITTVLFLGSLLIVAGLTRTLAALRNGNWKASALGIALGILSAICGLFLVGFPLLTLRFLTLLVAAYLIVDGLFGLVFALQSGKLSAMRWMLAGSAASAGLGAMILYQWPLVGIFSVAALIGLSLLFHGAATLAVASSSGPQTTEESSTVTPVRYQTTAYRAPSNSSILRGQSFFSRRERDRSANSLPPV